MLLPALRYAALRYGQRHMPEFLHYSPHTGISYYTDHDELTGKTYLHSQQDVTALVERNKKLANEGVTDHGIKRDLWLWASLPSTVIVDLMRHDRDDFRAQMGQQNLGFEEAQLRTLLEDAGFEGVLCQPLPSEAAAKSPALLLAAARRNPNTNII